MKKKNINKLKNRAWEWCSKYYRKKYPVCLICNKRESQIVHHIVKRSVSNYLYFDSVNLLSLCTVCHNKIHPQNRNRVSFDDIEYSNILCRIIGEAGLQYLLKYKHEIHNDVAYELEDLINYYKEKIKELNNG